jgi:uncharacterized protein YjbI with pentapeptide repeats
MRYFVIFLVLIGFTSSVFAFEPAHTNYFSNPEFQTHSVIEKNYKYEIPYHLSAGVLESMTVDCESTLLLLEIRSDDAGYIAIHLPRVLIDSKSSISHEDDFIILLDGEEVTFEETSDSISRTLTIPFESDISHVEIIGVNYPEHAGINACNEGHNPPYSYWFPPLKQFKSGVPVDEIQCRELLILVTKNDGSPACVTESTKQKLIERGWTETQTKNFATSADSQKLLSILEAGHVEEFNKLKASLIMSSNPFLSLDGTNLQGLDLSGIDLTKVHIAGTDMQNANLQGIVLDYKNIKDTNLQGADLTGSDLSDTWLRNVNLQNANMQNANLKNIHLGDSNIDHANFMGADLRGVNFQFVSMVDTNFEGANMQGTNLSETNLDNLNFQGANLQFAHLKHATLSNTNLKNTNLSNANLENANLGGADLSGADLNGAILKNANLLDANFTNTKNISISTEEARQRGAIVS